MSSTSLEANMDDLNQSKWLQKAVAACQIILKAVNFNWKAMNLTVHLLAIYLSPLCSPFELKSQLGHKPPSFSTPYHTPSRTATGQEGFLLPLRTSSMSNWTPTDFSLLRSPNVNFSAGRNKLSSSPFQSPFLKRRVMKWVLRSFVKSVFNILFTLCRSDDKPHQQVFIQKPRKIVCDSPVDLDKKLSVRMVLKDLKLEHLIEAFEKHEVGFIAFARKYGNAFMRSWEECIHEGIEMTHISIVSLDRPECSVYDVRWYFAIYRRRRCQWASTDPRVHSRLQNAPEAEENSMQECFGSQWLSLKLKLFIFNSK